MRISDWSSDVCSSDLHRCDVRRFVEISAGGVPTARNVGKPPNFTPESAGGSIWLANQRENLPMIGNGARNAIHRPVGGLSGRGRAREPRGVARPPGAGDRRARHGQGTDRRAPPRSEEYTSELQSLMRISYAVFCLKKNNKHRSP